MYKSNQRGFTLIELIVVIVVLGILAAFAVPKFMGVEVEARKAAVNGLAGSLRSSAAMAHGVWLAQSSPATITVDGAVVTMLNGYPNAASIQNTVQDWNTGFTVNGAGNVFTKTGATTPATCTATYTTATAVLAATVAVSTAGC